MKGKARVAWLGCVACMGLSCAATALTGGSKVAVGKQPPHAGCRELAIVMGSGGGGGWTGSEHKMESALNDIRNRTANAGGDFVVLDTSGADIKGVTLTGRAFDCSSGPAASEPAPTAVQTAGAESAAPSPTPSVEERLLKLKELRDKELISEEEYAARRAEILKGI